MSASRRLLAAAAVCVVSLGLGWSPSWASMGHMTPGMSLSTLQPSIGSDDLTIGMTYVPGWWVPGDPMRTARGYETDARVVLVPAAVSLWLAAGRRPSPPSIGRVARITVVALGVAGVVALGRGMVGAAVSAAVVVALAGPVLWPERRWPGVASPRFQPRGGG